MAIKIIIKRRVPKEKEAELLPLLLQLRSTAVSQSGYVTGETLRNIDSPEDTLVITTWESVDAWKAWESSQTRKEIQDRINALLEEKTEYAIYLYG